VRQGERILERTLASLELLEEVVNFALRQFQVDVDFAILLFL
jgi:hypothetical protein